MSTCSMHKTNCPKVNAKDSKTSVVVELYCSLSMSLFDRSLVGACDGLNASVLKSTNYSRGPLVCERDPPDPIHSTLARESELSNGDERHPLHEKQRLSAQFSDCCTIFVASMIIATMGMLAYGNTQRGAHVVLTITLEPPVPSTHTFGATPSTNENGITWTPSQDQFDNMSLTFVLYIPISSFVPVPLSHQTP